MHTWRVSARALQRGGVAQRVLLAVMHAVWGSDGVNVPPMSSPLYGSVRLGGEKSSYHHGLIFSTEDR